MHVTLFCMQIFLLFFMLRQFNAIHDAIDELKRKPK